MDTVITALEPIHKQECGCYEQDMVMIENRERSSKIMPQKYFHDDDVIDYVTGWPRIRPSIFLYKLNNNIFHDN